MGEVYRARDTKLKRDVAVKVLPDLVASDPDRLARFHREAEVLAALNHPNIAHIYGFEDSDGTHALVMELVEGPTLAERLAQGPLPLSDALPIAKQIAEALEAAHEKGIIHRDLKPANIKVTSDGKVKVLDFGLAKMMEAASGEDTGQRGDVTASPTITSPAMTMAGAILGTAAYMSPEQAKGCPADKRSDVWAFGCVLFEMLTGKRVFDGDGVTETAAFVLTKEPVWAALPASTPTTIRKVLRRCLEKDPYRRMQAIGDVRLELEDLAATPMQRVAAPHNVRTAARSAIIGVIIGAAVTAFASFRFGASRELGLERHPVRLSLLPPAQTTFVGGYEAPYLALSPDGQRLALVPTPIRGRTVIWVRSLNSTRAQPLAGTDGATFPFWSPDGRQIAFFADGQLKVIDSAGGVAHAICSAADSRGGAWGRDGVIIFAPQLVGPLYRVSASGGHPNVVTTLDPARQEVSHRLPSFLPDGRHFLFLVQGGSSESSAVNVGSVDSKDRQPLSILATKAVYSRGYLLFARDRTVMAQRFDAAALRLAGEPVPIGDPLSFRTSVFGDALFSVADNGTIVVWNGDQASTRLTWIDRTGHRLGALGEAATYDTVALAPDERTLAAEITDPNTQATNIWLIDASTGIRSRLTAGVGNNIPVWAPDGGRIVFLSTRNGPASLFVKQVDGVGDERLLLKSPDFLAPTDWSSDGRAIIFLDVTTNKIGMLPLGGERPATVVTHSEFVEGDGHLSPDGRWLAYTLQSSFQMRPPEPLFEMQTLAYPPSYPRQQYAVTARADRFLVNTLVEPAVPSPVTVLLDWQEELKRLVPTK